MAAIRGSQRSPKELAYLPPGSAKGEELALRRFPGYEVEETEPMSMPEPPAQGWIAEVAGLNSYRDLFVGNGEKLHEVLRETAQPGPAGEVAVPWELYTPWQ